MRTLAWSPAMSLLVACVAALAVGLVVLQEPPPPPPDPHRYVGDGYAIRIPPEYAMERSPDDDFWPSADGTRALRVLPLAVHDAPDHEAALDQAATETVEALRQFGVTGEVEPEPIELPAGRGRIVELTVNDGQRLTAVALADRPRAWIFLLLNFEAGVERATIESIELNPAGQD